MKQKKTYPLIDWIADNSPAWTISDKFSIPFDQIIQEVNASLDDITGGNTPFAVLTPVTAEQKLKAIINWSVLYGMAKQQEKINEAKAEDTAVESGIDETICCFCGCKIEQHVSGWVEGNNPAPADNRPGARCCDICNETIVMPVRLFIADRIRKYGGHKMEPAEQEEN